MPEQDQANDFHRLSKCGESLYQLLEIPKDSSIQDIKKKYRKMALKCHPDKNPSPEAEELFKKINHAHSILSDEKKRRLYDKHGSMGLYFADRFGDDVVEQLLVFSSPWFQCLFWTCCVLTGCCFGCCCCFCCCGKCKIPPPNDEEDVPDLADFEAEENHHGDDVVVTEPPRSTDDVSVDKDDNVKNNITNDEVKTKTADSVTPNEKTALNSGEKKTYGDVLENSTVKESSEKNPEGSTENQVTE